MYTFETRKTGKDLEVVCRATFDFAGKMKHAAAFQRWYNNSVVTEEMKNQLIEDLNKHIKLYKIAAGGEISK